MNKLDFSAPRSNIIKMKFQKNKLTERDNKILGWIGTIVRQEDKKHLFKRLARFSWNYNPMSLHKHNLGVLCMINKRHRHFTSLIKAGNNIVRKYKK